MTDDNKYSCIICGGPTNNGRHDTCQRHALDVQKARTTKGNLVDAVRNIVDNIHDKQLPYDCLSSVQRSALLFSELSDDSKVGVAYFVGVLVRQMEKEAKASKRRQKVAHFGALSGLELLVSLMESGYLKERT